MTQQESDTKEGHAPSETRERGAGEMKLRQDRARGAEDAQQLRTVPASVPALEEGGAPLFSTTYYYVCVAVAL